MLLLGDAAAGLWQGVCTRDAATCPALHGDSPHGKESHGPCAHSASGEKMLPRGMNGHLFVSGCIGRRDGISRAGIEILGNILRGILDRESQRP